MWLVDSQVSIIYGQRAQLPAMRVVWIDGDLLPSKLRAEKVRTALQCCIPIPTPPYPNPTPTGLKLQRQHKETPRAPNRMPQTLLVTSLFELAPLWHNQPDDKFCHCIGRCDFVELMFVASG